MRLFGFGKKESKEQSKANQGSSTELDTMLKASAAPNENDWDFDGAVHKFQGTGALPGDAGPMFGDSHDMEDYKEFAAEFDAEADKLRENGVLSDGESENTMRR